MMSLQGQLWEKKIQLDKETRDALDPSVGQAESQNMEHEIHRMDLRMTACMSLFVYLNLRVVDSLFAATVQREQDRLSTEIERAIQKRTTIATRFKGKATAASAAGSKVAPDLTQANVKRRIGTLKREVNSVSPLFCEALLSECCSRHRLEFWRRTPVKSTCALRIRNSNCKK
jgi:hypothetical protein